MKRNTMSYKVQQFLMFAGVAAVLFCAVVVIPFVYGIYLTLTSWDGIAKTKPFVGLANYAEAFKDVAYWQALGRTAIYSIFALPRGILRTQPDRRYRSRLCLEIRL